MLHEIIQTVQYHEELNFKGFFQNDTIQAKYW